MKKLIRESLNEKQKFSALLNLKPKQSKHDDSQFVLELPNGDCAVAMGDEFNPDAYDMSLEEMLEFVDKGINQILNDSKDKFSYEDLGEFADFFETEFNDDDGEGLPDFLTKEYVIGKMLCGKESAKSFNVDEYDEDEDDDDEDDGDELSDYEWEVGAHITELLQEQGIEYDEDDLSDALWDYLDEMRKNMKAEVSPEEFAEVIMNMPEFMSKFIHDEDEDEE